MNDPRTRRGTPSCAPCGVVHATVLMIAAVIRESWRQTTPPFLPTGVRGLPAARTIAAAQIAGIRAMLLHAMSDDAKRFYVRAGFHECPVDPVMMMMITLAEVEKNLSPSSAS